MELECDLHSSRAKKIRIYERVICWFWEKNVLDQKHVNQCPGNKYIFQLQRTRMLKSQSIVLYEKKILSQLLILNQRLTIYSKRLKLYSRVIHVNRWWVQHLIMDFHSLIIPIVQIHRFLLTENLHRIHLLSQEIKQITRKCILNLWRVLFHLIVMVQI